MSIIENLFINYVFATLVPNQFFDRPLWRRVVFFVLNPTVFFTIFYNNYWKFFLCIIKIITRFARSLVIILSLARYNVMLYCYMLNPMMFHAIFFDSYWRLGKYPPWAGFPSPSRGVGPPAPIWEAGEKKNWGAMGGGVSLIKKIGVPSAPQMVLKTWPVPWGFRICAWFWNWTTGMWFL